MRLLRDAGRALSVPAFLPAAVGLHNRPYPHHESMLPDLLGRDARMPVEPVHDETPVEGGHVYVIPPNTSLSLEGGVLRLGARLPLYQVLDNLLNNAHKYTPAGGHVRVGAEAVNNYAEVRVRDDGIRLAPEFRPHVFEAFVQGGHGADRSQGGLGSGCPSFDTSWNYTVARSKRTAPDPAWGASS